MFVVGLTGGIGCGKSTIENLFKQYSEAEVSFVDTDAIAHLVQRPHGPCLGAIVRLFGEDILKIDGKLDRPKLRSIVFGDPSAKAALENITSPAIYAEAVSQIAEKSKTSQYIILSVPMLYESEKFQALTNRILAIYCPAEVQIERVMARNNMTELEVKAIIAAQATNAQRRSISDDIILNYECKPEDNMSEVNKLHRRYLQMAKLVK